MSALPDWISGTLARSLRAETLSVALRYRRQYRTDRMGFHKRMMAQALELARDYRRREHEQQQPNQRAA